jgi:hypothetical protein
MTNPMTRKINDNSEDKYSVNIIKDLGDVEIIRDVWKVWTWHHFSDIDFFRALVDARSEILRPYVVVISKNEVPVAAVVARIEKQRLTCKFGYKTVYAPDVRCLYVEYEGILGDRSYVINNIIISEILQALRKGEADIALFSSLRTDSELHHIAKSRSNFFFCDHIAKQTLHWKIDLPATFEDFQKTISSKHRYWLRRMEKLLQQDYSGKVIFRIFRTKDELNQFCDDSEEIAKKGYQRGLGVGFVSNDEMKKRLKLSVKLGCFRGYILYNNNRPISFWLTTLYGKTLYLDSTGYDPDYRKYEPGTILFMKLIESVYHDAEKIDNIDFGFGDAPYKERFGNKHWNEATIYLFAPTFKGFRINVVRSLIIGLALVAESVLKRMNMMQKVKKYWRRKTERLS